MCNLLLAYLPLTVLRDHSYSHELIFSVSHLIMLITMHRFKITKLGIMPLIKFIPRNSSKNKEFNARESKLILFVVFSSLSFSIIARVVENAFHPLPVDSRFDTMWAVLLLWRQMGYTMAPLVQILLNEHQQKVPKLPFLAMHLRAAVVLIQSILTICGIEVFGGLRLAVFLRDGIFYGVIMMQIQVYNKLQILNRVQEFSRLSRGDKRQ